MSIPAPFEPTAAPPHKNIQRENEKSMLTVEKYVRDVRALLVWLNGRPLSKGEMLRYKARLLENYAVTSVNSMLSAINCYFDYIRQRRKPQNLRKHLKEET